MIEFLTVAIMGVLAFFGAFASILASLAVFVLAGIAGIFMICAFFALGVWGITRDPYALRALGIFLTAGAVPFTLMVLIQWYGAKLRDWLTAPRPRRVRVELLPPEPAAPAAGPHVPLLPTHRRDW